MAGTVDTYLAAYMPYAVKMELDTGVSGVALLAQSALESGYGGSKPGNMMFGIKADSSWKGKRQLLKTTEQFPASKRSTYKKYYTTGGRQLVSVKPDYKKVKGISYDLFTVRTWFRAYDSPYDSFVDHIKFLRDNSRYKRAFTFKADPRLFLKEVAAAGYATGTSYYHSLLDIINLIEPKYKVLYSQIRQKIESNPAVPISGLFFFALLALAAVASKKKKQTSTTTNNE